MPPRIAIPMPHSSDPEYAERSIPQYEYAVKLAGGEPVRIPLDLTPAEVIKIVECCDGILLPGSKADVDPAKFGATRSPYTAAADLRRGVDRPHVGPHESGAALRLVHGGHAQLQLLK